MDATDHPLDLLDAVLFRSRRWVRRPGHRARFRELMSSPVEFTTLRVLRSVEQQPEPPSVGDMATILAVDPSTASRFIEHAVERGFLERAECQDDRRRTRVALTRSGFQTLEEANRARRTILRDVTDGWSDQDIGMLTALLERLGEGFDRLEYEA